MNLCCSGIQAVPLPILNHNHNHNHNHLTTWFIFIDLILIMDITIIYGIDNVSSYVCSYVVVYQYIIYV